MPIENKNAFIADMSGVVPNARQPKPAIKPPSESKLNRQVEKAQNKAAREARKQNELDYEKELNQPEIIWDGKDKNGKKGFGRIEEREYTFNHETGEFERDMKTPKPPGMTLKEELEAAKSNQKREKGMSSEGETKEDANRRKDKADSDYYHEIASAYGKYAQGVSADKHEARKARDDQEKAQLKADSIDRRMKIEGMEDTPEKSKLMDTYKRHKWFDRMKTIFRKDNALSHQDVTFQRGEQEFTNVGRAFYGGTKPMYKFEDEKGNTHLYKEAVNCLGMKKPEGALVTEAASKIQHMVCDDAYVPAFAVKSKEGNVLGSMQQMLKKDDNGIDLFSLQDNVTELGETLKARPELGKELIREHALDWMLCNFDTKGENFIPLKSPNPDGSTITSIDKEAAFNHLSDPDSQNMSYTYKPHSNNTFYNVMFQAYAEGKIDLPMDHMDTMVKKIDSIDNEKYMDCFSDMLDNKYGENTPERQTAYDSILERKTDIGKQYGAFRKQLNLERTKNMEMGDKAKEVTEPTKTVTEPEKAKTVAEPEKAKTVAEPEKAKVVAEPEKAKTVTEPEKAKTVTEPEKAKVVAEPEKAKVVAEPEKAKTVTQPEKAKVAAQPAQKETRVKISLEKLEKVSGKTKRDAPRVQHSERKAPVQQAVAPSRGK